MTLPRGQIGLEKNDIYMIFKMFIPGKHSLPFLRQLDCWFLGVSSGWKLTATAVFQVITYILELSTKKRSCKPRRNIWKALNTCRTEESQGLSSTGLGGWIYTRTWMFEWRSDHLLFISAIYTPAFLTSWTQKWMLKGSMFLLGTTGFVGHLKGIPQPDTVYGRTVQQWRDNEPLKQVLGWSSKQQHLMNFRRPNQPKSIPDAPCMEYLPTWKVKNGYIQGEMAW